MAHPQCVLCVEVLLYWMYGHDILQTFNGWLATFGEQSLYTLSGTMLHEMRISHSYHMSMCTVT